MGPIVFLTSGTRGDVQPVIPLAQRLQGNGQAVRIAAPPAFRELVESHGVPFTPVDGNPSDLMTARDGEIPLTFDGNPIRSARSTLNYLREAQTVYTQMLANAWKACQDASALVIGLPTIWGASIAEKLKIPCIGAFLQPLTPTRDFPCPVLPSTQSWGGAYNRLSYPLAGLATFLPWRKVINDWRTRTLGLEPLPISGPLPRPFGRIDLKLYGFSEQVLPRPQDWDKDSVTTGYWPLPSKAPLDNALEAFLQTGLPPMYFGFGSPGTYQPEKIFEVITQVTHITELRAVVSLPKDMQVGEVPAHIHLLRGNMPHDRLFPRLAGAVHHGGAGTTGTALLAGIPSLVTPVAVDQFFWGARVSALGVGPEPIPQRELQVKNLAEGLMKMKERGMKERAQELGERLRHEDGIGQAVRALEALINRRQAEGPHG
ncbi:MAG: glycosyltransferase family 1 protein [Chloroflexi bacterium]|nr:glycosyltransferase family 1 protein [Chloroflexota bacterium]